MRKPRMAGDVVKEPGFWEWLGDNGFTRAWSEATAGLIKPLDRMVASDEELALGMAKAFGRGAAVEGEVPASVMLKTVDPSGKLSAAYAEHGPALLAQLQAMSEASGHQLSMREAAELLFRDSMAPKLGRQDLVRGMDVYGTDLPVSGAGVAAHALLSHPAAGYGITAGALGAGGYGAYQWLNRPQESIDPELDGQESMMVV